MLFSMLIPDGNPQPFHHALKIWPEYAGFLGSTGHIPVVALQGAD